LQVHIAAACEDVGRATRYRSDILFGRPDNAIRAIPGERDGQPEKIAGLLVGCENFALLDCRRQRQRPIPSGRIARVRPDCLTMLYLPSSMDTIQRKGRAK
jgi:hypothetical protein